jgi:CubicO group peptidase (beta-lactamase class C family)
MTDRCAFPGRPVGRWWSKLSCVGQAALTFPCGAAASVGDAMSHTSALPRLPALARH